LNPWCQMYIDPESSLLPLLANRYGDFEVWHGIVPDLVDTAARKTYAEFVRKNFIRKGIGGFKLDEVDGLSIKGARTPLELRAGPCILRFAYRSDAGSAGIRLWTPDGKEISEFHVDELPAAAGWQAGIVRATLPTAGTYALYIGKAHASSGARHIAFRNITVIQRPPRQDGQTAWSREVYLPEGTWRNFWTDKVFRGGQHHIVTATPERPAVFVRENTLLPLAEPPLTIDEKTVFTVYLAVYGDQPRPCKLLEDDGQTFDFEKGKWATLTVKPDGTVDRPDHSQPRRYRVAGRAEPPASVLQTKLLVTAE